MLETAMSAAAKLQADGVSAGVVSMPTVAPLDTQSVIDSARGSKLMVTVEEHGDGGLGSRVGTALAEAGVGVKFKAMHLTTNSIKLVGPQEWLRAQHGLSSDGICEQVKALLVA
jgi:transketolase